MELLIHLMAARCKENMICHLESAVRAVNSSANKQMVTEKNMDKRRTNDLLVSVLQWGNSRNTVKGDLIRFTSKSNKCFSSLGLSCKSC